MFLNKWVLSFAFLFCVALGCTAGPSDFHVATSTQPLTEDTRFDRNHFDLSLMTGVIFSPIKSDIFPHADASFDYTQTELRAGWMMNSPWEAGIFRGNVELLLGLGGGAVFDGPGTAIGDGDIFIRYNFIQPRACVVPYFQLGMGLNVSDASGDHTQRIIGRALEFTLQGEFGLRILLNPRWSLDLEGAYQHISNANTADRNVGVNGVGGLVGLTRSF